MSLIQAKVLLDKINTLYRSMSLDGSNVNTIERDLMLSYIRQLYESFLLQDAVVTETKEKTPVRPETPKVEKQIEIPVIKPAESVIKPAEAPVVKEDKPLVVEFMSKSNPKPAPPAPPPVPVQVVPPAPKAPEPVVPQHTEPVKHPVYNSPPAFSGSDDTKVNALFSSEKAADLSSRLGELSIPDIRKSMGLNDRQLVIKELFGGDNVVFDEAVALLNGMNSFEQAQQYMTENLVHRYKWTSDDKKSAARDFIKLVRRRYK